MNYILVTEVRPIKIYTEPRELDEAEILELVNCSKKGFLFESPNTTPLPSFITMAVSEETFKFIESVSTIGVPIFGEKEYKINNLTFQIHTQEDYENRFGEYKI